MLDLIAITYENIWPFKDQKLSLFFKEGNFLVKAPIGTGKSFLFLFGESDMRNPFGNKAFRGLVLPWK